MITIIFALMILAVIGAVACLLPVLALPLLDVVVGSFIVIKLVKLIKKLLKKDKA